MRNRGPLPHGRGSVACRLRAVASGYVSVASSCGAAVILFFAGALMGYAQGFGQQSLEHRIDLPHDSPVSLVGDEWGGSAANVRGGAFVLDVRVSLSLRNSGQRRIHGITLAVLAQETAPGGKGSIS